MLFSSFFNVKIKTIFMKITFLMRSSTIISNTLFFDGPKNSIKSLQIIMLAFVSNSNLINFFFLKIGTVIDYNTFVINYI